MLLIASLGFVACDGTTPPETGLAIEIVSGADQTAGSGTPLPTSVTVAVRTADGVPARVTEVRWRVIAGGGSANPSVTLTDSLGRASVVWTLGNDVGTQLLLASTADASLTIRATGTLAIAAVSAGQRHTCALSTRGDAFCWGANSRGQLGDGTTTTSGTPVRVRGPAFRLLAAGWSHSCGVSTLGRAYCWGDNVVGQLGLGPGSSSYHVLPTPVAPTDPFVALAGGYVHTCALTEAGDAVCWGESDAGQLGGAGPGPVRIVGQRFRQISAGEFHSCAVTADATLSCWGWNSSGELGIGAPNGFVARAPAPLPGPERFTAVSASVRHSCALGTDARVYCWGRSNGEIGQDVNFSTNVPGVVPGATGFTEVGTGNTHTCGLAGGRAYCWGTLLGDGTPGASKTPVAVASPLTFTALSVGYDHSCGVANGDVWCWGSNSDGQLGQPGSGRALAPVRVAIPGFD